MNTNLIDQQIIDSFFKYYKKDVNTIQEDEFRILKEKISQNLEKIIDLPEGQDPGVINQEDVNSLIEYTK